MVAYGGGSILKNGVYDAVVSALKGKHPFETFAGIEANPDFATCMKVWYRFSLDLERGFALKWIVS